MEWRYLGYQYVRVKYQRQGRRERKKKEEAHAAPMFKCEMITGANGQVKTDILTDYSPNEIKNLLDKYKERKGGKLIPMRQNQGACCKRD